VNLERLRTVRWGVPAFVLAVAAFIRLWGLGHPRALVFDETFYVKDGWSLWNLGYSATWPGDADAQFAAGSVDGYFASGSYVVHPPLAKWLIGLGMAIGGPEDPSSWRLATAIVGILAVMLLFLIAQHLFHSTLLGGIAGLLFAVDGNAIVMSRVALLDNFLMFFALLGVGAVLLDRRWTQRRLEDWVLRRRRDGGSLDWGPVLWWRPWLLAAGVAFGLASAVKWSGFYFLAVFAVYTLVSDALARRRLGILFWGTGTVARQGPASFVLTVPVALAAHLATWAGWFTSDGGYGRHWADSAANAWSGAFAWVPAPLQSWIHYQAGVYAYHVGESRDHPYASPAWQWLLMLRPTSMYYSDDPDGCTVEYCGQSITGIANPLIWWAATAAVLYLIYRLVRYREWRVGFILVGLVAGYLPWLLYPDRTIYHFYTIAFEPTMILALTAAIALILRIGEEPVADPVPRRLLVGGFLVIVIAVSVFFWPLWTGIQVPYEYIRAHWWLPGWR